MSTDASTSAETDPREREIASLTEALESREKIIAAAHQTLLGYERRIAMMYSAMRAADDVNRTAWQVLAEDSPLAEGMLGFLRAEANPVEKILEERMMGTLASDGAWFEGEDHWAIFAILRSLRRSLGNTPEFAEIELPFRPSKDSPADEQIIVQIRRGSGKGVARVVAEFEAERDDAVARARQLREVFLTAVREEITREIATGEINAAEGNHIIASIIASITARLTEVGDSTEGSAR